MAEKNVSLTKQDRISVCWRSTFLQGSWNYERMQNGGFCYAMIPAIKRLYSTKEDQAAALKRHLEFFNTQPYVGAPILGVTMALEEDRANGAPVILGALAASFAMSGNILGPILFFVLWNVIRYAFLWYTQEFGYKAGTAITKDLSGGLLQKVTQGASILGMFVLGALVQRWVNVGFPFVVSRVTLSEGAFIDWESLPLGGEGIKSAFMQYTSGMALDPVKVTTMQDNLNSLVPGLAGLLLTFLCMYLLKKKVSPIVIILGLFVVGIVLHVIGIM